MDLTSCPVTPITIQRNLKSNGKTVLQYHIRRPSFPNSGKLRRLQQYFTRLEQIWQTKWENTLYQKASQAYAEQSNQNIFLPWQANMDYEITFWKPSILSMRINVKEQGPVSPPVSLCIGEVWDCNSGYPCSLLTFLPTKQRHWKSDLIKQLQIQAKQRLDQGECLLYENCLLTIKQNFDSCRFYLTDAGLVIYYPMYTLGAYGEGIPTFTIPTVLHN